MNKGHILVLGGTRSGKSQFAENLALKLSNKPAYIATAQTHFEDKGMAERIALHQQRRKDSFTNIEEPFELEKAILNVTQNHDVVLVDCLTLWASNLMGAKRDIALETKNLCAALQDIENSSIIFVSSEVGMGIVPNNELAREFRDQLGQLHQDLAKNCKNVYFIAAGLPLLLKGNLSE